MNAKRPHTLTDFRKLGKKKCCDPEAAKMLHDKRQLEAAFLPPVKTRRTLPISETELAIAADNEARRRHPRRKNWEPARPARIEDCFSVRDNDHGNYSRRCTYTHWTYTPLYRSFVILPNCTARTIIYTRLEKRRIIRAPKGMAFEFDHNGLMLRRLTDKMDLHVSGEDLQRKDFCTWVRQEMAANYRRRVEEKWAQIRREHEKEIFARERNAVHVSLHDSSRAGNCIAGTLNFAEQRLGLRRDEIIEAGYLMHTSAARLLALANGNKASVERAIWAAWERETLVQI